MGQSSSRSQEHWDAGSTALELARQTTPRRGHDPHLYQETLSFWWAVRYNIAPSIAQKGSNITLIAAGGAVNSIYFKICQSTYKVFFFNSYLTANESHDLLNVIRWRATHAPASEASWLNNRGICHFPGDMQVFTDQALAQQEVILSEEGLTVLAAPWQWLFCSHLDRLALGSGLHGARQGYDVDDAMQCLVRYLIKAKETEVSYKTVRGWFAQYSMRWSDANDALVPEVNAKYRDMFQEKKDIIIV